MILPALLLSNSNHYHLPDIIVASEYVTIEGKKISKSAGTCLTGEELLSEFDSDMIRFYFAKNVNDKKDVNFTFQDFVNTVNGELINNWGNLVNRTLSFVKSKFGGRIKYNTLDDEVKQNIETTFKNVSKFVEEGKIVLSVKEIMDLVSYSNKLFDSYAPWATLKVDEEACNSQLFNILTLIDNINIMLSIVTTKGSQKVFKFLGTNENGFAPYYFDADIVLSDEISPLYARLDYKAVSEKFSKYI